VHGHLARNGVEHLQTRELLEIRRGSGLQTRENANVPIVLLIQRLRHVTHDKQGRWKRIAVTLAEVANTCTLNGRLQVSGSNVHAHHAARLSLLPLQQVTTATHGQLEQRRPRLNHLLEEVSLDAIVEGIRILQHTVTRPEVIAVIQVILERVIRRIRHAARQHLLGHGHVNVGPNRVRSRDIISKLRLMKNLVLVRLVVPSSQNGPAICLQFTHTLDNRIVLNTNSLYVNRNTLRIQRNGNLVRIRVARH